MAFGVSALAAGFLIVLREFAIFAAIFNVHTRRAMTRRMRAFIGHL
jgi:hypothetical protein